MLPRIALLPARRAALRAAACRPTAAVRRFASPADDPPAPPPKDRAELMNQLREDPWVKEATGKIAQNPEAVKAIMEFEQVLQAKGYDVRSGQQPGKLQMMKMMMDKDFRDAMLKLAEEMQKSGIDGNSPQMKELMKRMGVGQ